MFKSYQDTSSADQFKGFPNLNFQGSNSAYGFSGVFFWLDAAFGLNTQTNLDAVSRWQPRFGKSAFIQNTAGSQPRLRLNDINYNNFPSVESIGNRFMLSDTSSGLPYSSSCTVAVVSKVNTSTDVNAIIGLNSGSTIGINDGGIASGYTGFGIANSSQIFQGTTESTNARIKIISFNSIVINGILESTGISLNSAIEFNGLFTNIAGSTGRLTGSIAEIIAFNYSMTSTDMIALSDRINQKYALY